jgi:hypothetical protein
VRPDEADVHDLGVVINFHHEPVLVSADVEHHTITFQYARATVLLLDVDGGVPVRLPGLMKPGLQARFGIRVPRGKLSQLFSGNDMHTIVCSREEIKRNVPILGTTCPEETAWSVRRCRARHGGETAPEAGKASAFAILLRQG